MKIILIAGKAGSGKTTLGKEIETILQTKKAKVLRTEYSKYLKLYAKEIFNYQENDVKPRKFLQDTGTFLRSIDEHFFTKRMLEDFLVYAKYVDYVIISDVRLIREITDIKEKLTDVVTIKIINDLTPNNLTSEERNHITEKELDNYSDFDYIIKNKNAEEIKEIAQKIVEEII